MLSSGRLACRVVLAAAIAAVAAYAGAAPAMAGTARSSGTGLDYRALGGEANRALFVWGDAGVTVSDPGAALVIGCMPRTLTEVRCPAPGEPVGAAGAGCDPCLATMGLGDGDDTGEIRNAPDRPTLSVLIDGGPGNDTLSANRGMVVGGAGNDTLSGEFLAGGPGDDRLAGTETDNVLDGGPGADLLKGMGGIDRTTYADRTEGVHVTIDGRSDDGAPGEGDDVETEDVNGGAGSDVLLGDDGRNRLTGLCGDDRLTGGGGGDVLQGGAGADVIDGGAGDDIVYAGAGPFAQPPPPAAPCDAEPSDGSDLVACGAGDDLALAGAGDRVAADCERVYFGAVDVPRLKIVVPAVERLARGGGDVRVAAVDVTQRSGLPVEGAFPLSGTVSVRAAGGAPEGVLGRTDLPRLDAGSRVAVAVPLKQTAERALRDRGGQLRLVVTVTVRDARGATSLTRRTIAIADR
jgi:Ca2+-binding RTX toxin-like protein